MHSDRITNRSSSGLAASLVISSNPAVLYGLTIYNGKATAQYIQLHDAASLPADASTPIYPPILIGSGETKGLSFPEGRIFDTGIVVCNSSTSSTKTIGSADCMFDAQVKALIL